MPIYEFTCPIHGRFEIILSIQEFTKLDSNYYRCKNFDCIHKCEKEWSQVNWPSHGKPTVIFKNPKTGEVEVALHEHQKAPDGFIKEELKTPLERSKFEKEETQKQRIEDEYKTEERRYAVDYTRKQRHDDLKAKMSSITSKADNPTVAEDLLKKAMERTRNKKVPAKRSEMRLDVNHQNKSNLDKG